MAGEKIMLYGIIDYEDEKYIYRLENNMLYMEEIEALGNGWLVLDWLSNPPNFEGDYLKGINAENGNEVLFKTYPGNAGFKNMQIRIKIQYYIELQKDTTISKLSFVGDEINYIYNIAQGIESYEFNEEGTASCKTKSFEETTSSTEYFNVENKEVGVYFAIYRGINFQSCYSLNLYSSINLLVDANNNYDFLVHLCYIMKKFLGFLCYRDNIHFKEIVLYTQESSKTYRKIGKIIFANEKGDIEDDKIIKERNITYTAIKGKVGNILQDIEDKRLYLRHIPDSYRDSLKIDYSKFIMITAAIEWIFKNLYPKGLKHSDKTLKAQENVRKELENKVTESTGAIKKQYEFLQKLVGSDSLSQKIVQIGNDYDSLLGTIGQHLYSINSLSEEFNYTKIGTRIQQQRNNFAHGNLDKEFEDIAALDLIFLEKVVYLLQLSTYGLSDDIILEQVKRLFGMKF